MKNKSVYVVLPKEEIDSLIKGLTVMKELYSLGENSDGKVTQYGQSRVKAIDTVLSELNVQKGHFQVVIPWKVGGKVSLPCGEVLMDAAQNLDLTYGVREVG